jgi:hypothetical protein
MNTVQTAVPAEDIAEAIRKFIRTYDPLKQARDYIHFQVSPDGKVTLQGHVRSIQAKRVLEDNIPDIEGVTGLDSAQFYDDETLRLSVGKHIPNGVIARANLGILVLAVPEGIDGAALADSLAKLPGIRQVEVRPL